MSSGAGVATTSLIACAWLATGCFPNPDDLRSNGTPNGGATGSGGSTATGAGGGKAGAGGAGAGAGGSAGTLGATGGKTGGGGTTGLGGAGLGGATGTGGRNTGGATGTGGMTGTGGKTGAGGYAGAGLVLTPDATGWIDKSTNSVGIQGGWYGFSDGVGANGQTATGICEMAGHAASTCSMLTMPSPTVTGFPNTGGRMCAVGTAARVLNKTGTTTPDFSSMYGASIAFDFNYNSTTMTKGVFNAQAAGVTGIQFDIDNVPANGMHIQLQTPGTEAGLGGPPYWGANQTFPLSPVHAGTNRIHWADVVGPYGLGLDPTQLASMNFAVVTQTQSASNFSFCISNVTLLKDVDPVRTCTDPAFPVFCPGQDGAPDDCWTGGVNCNTVLTCNGAEHACGGQDHSRYFDCAMNQCLICTDPTAPQACNARDTVPATCWPAGIFCSTVTDCGGGDYFGCFDPSLFYFCSAGLCY